MENTPLASDDVVLLIPVDTLVTVTEASATPASPLRADVVSFEANVSVSYTHLTLPTILLV